MRYIRMLLSFFLSAFLLLALPLTAYAGTATSSTASPSDTLRPPVASGSDALPPLSMDDIVGYNGYDAPISPGFSLYSDSDQSNTVTNWNSVRVYIWGPDGFLKQIGNMQDAGGMGVFGKEFTIPDGRQASGFILYSPRAALPSTGKWKSQIAVQTSAGLQPNNLYAEGYVERPNATELGGPLAQVSHDYIPPDFYTAIYNMDTQSLTNVNYYFPFTFPWSGGSEPYSLNLRVMCEYTSYESGEINKPVAPPPDVTDQNNTIIDQGQQQIEQGDTIIELIKNTIETISFQLTAFWNQLAGEFTNLYNKMNQQHAEQLEADRQNTDDLISNQDENTDTVVNGYDNSGMNADNDRLNSSLTEYGQAEDSLMDDVNDHISGIDFDYNFDSIISVIGSVSDFFQGLYERSGQFQIVINVCLILSLASCAVGIYRLKGGG